MARLIRRASASGEVRLPLIMRGTGGSVPILSAPRQAPRERRNSPSCGSTNGADLKSPNMRYAFYDALTPRMSRRRRPVPEWTATTLVAVRSMRLLGGAFIDRFTADTGNYRPAARSILNV